MKLASKLKKKSLKSEKNSSSPSGLAKWEAKLAEQSTEPETASPSRPRGSTQRRASSSITRSDSSEEGKREKREKKQLGSEKERKASTSSPLLTSTSSETGSTTSEGSDNCDDAQLSPRRRSPPSTPTKSSGGLLGRLNKSKMTAADKKLASSEEEARRKASQMAALDMFRENGPLNYTVPAVYAESVVQESEIQMLQRPVERENKNKRSNDVLIEIVDGRPQLRAGTFEEIVKWIIFNNVNEHVSSFLITFRAYGTPAELWAAFMRVFQIIEEKDKMPALMKADLRKKTLDLLVEWIRRFSYKDFTENGDKTLFKKLTKFVKSLPPEEANQFKLLFMRKRDDTSVVAKAKEADGLSNRSGSFNTVSSQGSGRFDLISEDTETDSLSLSMSSVDISLSVSSSDIAPVVATAASSAAAATPSPALTLAPPPAPPASLHSFPPRVIAQQMTLLDSSCFAEIQPEEMLLSNWTRPNKEEVAPTLTYLARQFNMWAGMVATDIILANSLMDQVTMVKYYISVLHHLYRLNNFQSLMAVMSGLNCSSVSRLKRVWNRVPAKYSELFANMEQAMTPLGNFKYYRQILAENRDKNPIIPYLVVFLRDLTFINDGNCETLMSEPMAPTDIPRELPNFEKMVLLGQQILELEAYRKVPYDITEQPAVTAMLKNVRYLDEDSLHRRSVEQEPIHSLNEQGEGEVVETRPAEVVVKNPLVALKAISKDFKAASASEENDLSDRSLTLSETDELSSTF